MPSSWAASSASADLPGNRQRVIERNRPLRDAIGERGSVHQFEHECLSAIVFFDAVNGGDVRMVQRREDLALRAWKRREAIGIERRIAPAGPSCATSRSSVVSRAVDLAHSAGAQPSGDLISAERFTERHSREAAP